MFLLLIAAGGGAAVVHDSIQPTTTASSISDPTVQTQQKGVMDTQITTDAPTGHGQTTVSPEAGTYLAGKMAELEAIHESNLVQAKLDKTTNESSRRAELLDGAARIEKHVTTLRSYHKDAYRSYQAGVIDEETLVLRLMYVHMAAEGYEDPIEELKTSDEQVSDTSIEEQRRTLEGDVLAMQGTVRSTVVASMEGRSKANGLYTMAHQNGTVLVSLTDEKFLREAYRDDRRTRGATPVDQISSYNRKAEELYPWISEVEALNTIRGGPKGDMVSVDLVANDDNVVSLYMDSVDKEVVREDKRLDITAIPTATPIVRSDGQMKVIINRTYTTGPLQVSLVDAETNEPLDGTVRLDNQSVGKTGADGTIWTVEPPGETTLEATLGSRSLEITLQDQR